MRRAVYGRRSLGEDPFALFTRKLQELKAGVVGPAGGEAAPKSTINWWCWDAPGFQSCHKLAFQSAQEQCRNAGTPDDPTCLVLTADRLSKEGCPCPPAPPPEGMSAGTKQGIMIVLGIGVLVWALIPSKKEKAA